MKNNIIQVGFNLVREVFKEYSLEEEFMIFDNLMEKINPEGKAESIQYDFPIKLDITIIALCTHGLGRVSIGLNEIRLEKNRFAVILPGQIFQVTEITPDFKGLFIVLKNSFFNAQNHFIEVMTLQKILLQQHYLELPESSIPEFITIYNLIKEKIQEKENHYRSQIIQNYCSILFYDACNIFIQQDAQMAGKEKTNKEKVFEIFIKEVEAHYRKEHAISYYADKLCLTPKYLSSVIYEVSGKSATNWIKDYLVLEARALLKLGDKTIQQVSDTLNFANQSHFGRFFKHHTGMSPKEYQRS